MAELAAPTLPNPNYPVDPPPPPPPGAAGGGASTNPIFSCFSRRPSVRVTTEFDSDSSVFFHKVSCKLLDSLAKLKLSFNNDHKGELSPPQLSFISQYLSIHHNFEDQSTLLNGSVDVGPRLQLRATHDVKVRCLPLPLPLLP